MELTSQKIFKSVVAILIGLGADHVLSAVSYAIAGLAFPLLLERAGLIESAPKYILSTPASGIALVIGLFFSGLGGWLIARFDRNYGLWGAGMAGIVSTAVCSKTSSLPEWYFISSLILVLPAYLAGFLAKRHFGDRRKS